MKNRFEIDKNDAATAAQVERTLATYKAWLTTKPHVVDCDANLSFFRAYCSFEDDLTPADFDFALSNLESHLATQRVLTPEQVVAAENKHRRGLKLPELHELSRRENPRQTRGTLPEVWYGNDISTPAALKALAKNNLPAFKALVERFGEEVNKALGVVKTSQVGSIRMKI